MAQQHFEIGTPAFSENLIRKWSGKWKRSKKRKKKPFKTSKTSNIHTLTAHLCSQNSNSCDFSSVLQRQFTKTLCSFCSPKGFWVHSSAQGPPLLPTLHPLCAFGSGKTTRKAEFSTAATPGSWERTPGWSYPGQNPQRILWVRGRIPAPKANGSHGR